MHAPEYIRDVAVTLVPLSRLLVMLTVLRFISLRLHPDVLRVAGVFNESKRTLRQRAWVVIGTMLILSDFRDAFGILPALQLKLGWPHLWAMLLGLGFLLAKTRTLRDPVTLCGAGGVVALSFALAAIPFPKTRLGAWFCIFLTVVPFCWFRRFKLFVPEPSRPKQDWVADTYSRGPFFTTIERVQRIVALQIGVSLSAPVFFAYQWVPIEAVQGHFLVAGGSGTGKGFVFRFLMQTVFRRFGPGSNERALVFDAKHELVSILIGMGLGDLLRIMNPFDERCVVWDIERDFDSPSGALQLAQLLLPEDPNEKEPFFPDTARGWISDVILAHILAKREGTISKWNLTSIIRSLQSLDDIRAALALHPDTKDALRNIPAEQKLLDSVLATVDLVRRRFTVLAALWDEPSNDPARLFSLTEWMTRSEILVLGPSEIARAVMEPLNRLIIDRIGQLILDTPEPDLAYGANTSRTWMFLDECPRLGRMDRLETLMTNGRSKGLVAVLGIQDISDWRELYGPHLAITIAGGCEHKVFLQAPSAEHAEWYSELIGSQEVIQISKSISIGMTGNSPTSSTTWAASEKEKFLFTKGEFLTLGKPGTRTPLRPMPSWLPYLKNYPIFSDLYRFYALSLFTPIRGVCSIQGLRYYAELSFTVAVESLSPRSGKDLILRPVADQFLTRKEIKWLKLVEEKTPELSPALELSDALLLLESTPQQLPQPSKSYENKDASKPRSPSDRDRSGR